LVLWGWAAVAGQAGNAPIAFLEPAAVPTYSWHAHDTKSVDIAGDLNGTLPMVGESSIVADGIDNQASGHEPQMYSDPRHVITGNSVIGSDVSPPWTPGLGQCCYGVWSTHWHGTEVWHTLAKRLNDTAPLLLDRISEHKCPFGIALPGDVTWRGSIPEELRGIVAPQSAWTVVAVIYSYLPYLVAACIIIDFAIRRGTRQLVIIVWLLILVFLNEVIIKKLLSQPRPGTMLQMRDSRGRFVGSCVQKCGMPSSHSALAYGWFVLLLCDAVHRAHPHATDVAMAGALRSEPRFFDRFRQWYMQARTMEVTSRRGNGCFERWCRRCRDGTRKVVKMLALIVLAPLMPYHPLTHDELMAFIVFWSCVWLPVPFMRIVLYDHTSEQVLTGCTVGALSAMVWWRVVRCLQERYEHSVDTTILGCLYHNYPYPHWVTDDEKERLNDEWVIEEIERQPPYQRVIEDGKVKHGGPEIGFVKSQPELTFYTDQNGLRNRGTLDASGDKITWADGAVWHRVLKNDTPVEYKEGEETVSAEIGGIHLDNTTVRYSIVVGGKREKKKPSEVWRKKATLATRAPPQELASILSTEHGAGSTRSAPLLSSAVAAG